MIEDHFATEVALLDAVAFVVYYRRGACGMWELASEQGGGFPGQLIQRHVPLSDVCSKRNLTLHGAAKQSLINERPVDHPRSRRFDLFKAGGAVNVWIDGDSL